MYYVLHDRALTTPSSSGGTPTIIGTTVYSTDASSEQYIFVPAQYLASNPGQYMIVVDSPSSRFVFYSLRVSISKCVTIVLLTNVDWNGQRWCCKLHGAQPAATPGNLGPSSLSTNGQET